MTTIKRNKDGQMDLRQLRKELAKQDDLRVEHMHGSWMIKRLCKRPFPHWHCTPTPFWYSEREAIQQALGMEVETPGS